MASITALALTLAGSGLAVGCGGSDEDKPSDDAGAGGDDGGSSAGEDGGAGAGAGEDGAVDEPDAGGETPDAGPVVVEGPPVLDSASFKQVGRYGNDVRIGVVATTGGKDAVAVKVRVFNPSGGAIAVDADGDGTADGSEVRLSLVAPIAKGGASGESYALLPGLLRSDSLLGQAEVTLIDAQGVESDTLVALFEGQPELGAGDPCDQSYVDNRCSGALGCKDSGAGAACGEPEAPSIERIGYFDDSLGGRLLVSVNDPDDDIESYTVFFYDAERKPVLIDTDGDQSADSDSFTYEAEYPGRDGSFFARVDYPADITAYVEYVAVTVSDKNDGTVSTPNLIKKTPATLVANGRTCDTRTFSRCADASVCVPGETAPDGVCTTKTDARTDACAAAQILDPASGVVSVVGTIAAPSLWDATPNCRDNKGRSEALVKLTLSEAAKRVVLSTANKTTNFDSVLYLLDGCDGTPKDLWCSDGGNSSGWGDTLTLTNLPAGEYYVVVDSFNVWTSSPAFELTVDAS
jgi:hypothetical protein